MAGTKPGYEGLYFPIDREPLQSEAGAIPRVWRGWLQLIQQGATSLINLATDVTGRLPYANFTAFAAGSKLLGRGSSGPGDAQAISLGTGLTMSGTTLVASGGPGPGAGYWSELTNGDPVSPALIFDSFGDTIDLFVPTP